ncbi:hypothetical protein C2R22_13920 [Salinigranum rubrum]|uniref:Uncharacterized protein n=1 Tax=Salinigranum rubrum TaxID=755307 RepID=A0A2I8VKZ1_9EURY|nr:hypothetical protein [Salinigranum rubrum]AUV82603.1 hypothetical protein C2R22_13920 [Salinigranum rubrum]
MERETFPVRVTPEPWAECPYCGSEEVVVDVRLEDGHVQRMDFFCRDCEGADEIEGVSEQAESD